MDENVVVTVAPCQIGDRRGWYELPCPNREAVYQCEVLHFPHPEQRCRVGDHTVYHRKLGNGYPCYVVDNYLNSKKFGDNGESRK